MKGVPEELSPLRMALLVLYANARTERPNRVVQGANAYEIELLIRSRLGGVRGYGKSAVYDNSKQLASLGYLDEIMIGEGSKSVTAYVITEKGSEAIKRWMTTPTERPHLDSEVFLRVRAVDLVPPEDALRSLSALRPHLARWLADLDDAKARARYPTLGSTLELEYFELLLGAHRKWLDRAEKALKKRVAEDRARKRQRHRPMPR
jgi:DNA-binding PadR family transcriptional regulator